MMLETLGLRKRNVSCFEPNLELEAAEGEMYAIQRRMQDEQITAELLEALGAAYKKVVEASTKGECHFVAPSSG